MMRQGTAFTHDWIWHAIDTLAGRRGLSASGLARLAGLDPTAFNPSKRFTPEGRPRWPSTESIAKVLEATGTALDEFAMLEMSADLPAAKPPAAGAEAPGDLDAVPLLGEVRDAAVDGLAPVVSLAAARRRANSRRALSADGRFALSVADDSLEPAYSQGNTLIASVAERARCGDRVVVKPVGGLALPRLLMATTRARIELAPFRPGEGGLALERDAVDWIARIVWARHSR